MDNFIVTYVGKQHGDQLMSILGEKYTISHDWNGSWYLRMDIEWDYMNREVHLSMLYYVRYTLTRFHHTCP